MLLSNHSLEPYVRKSEIDLARVIPVVEAPHFAFFEKWLAQGYGKGMPYLARRAAERQDVRALMPEAKSLIVAAMVYKQAEEARSEFYEERGFRVAQYAWGEDYHSVFRDKLVALAEALKRDYPELRYRAYVDTGPILERDYAALAGLGWIGKNTCLINTRMGSYLFLGIILVNLPCTESMAPRADHCGNCRACLDACPTDALREPYTLDATTCISYWTIEHRGEFPADAPAWQDWLFGCDICQDVCPWNRKAPETTHPEFALRGDWKEIADLAAIHALTEEDFAKWKNSPLERTTLDGLKRNAHILRKC